MSFYYCAIKKGTPMGSLDIFYKYKISNLLDYSNELLVFIVISKLNLPRFQSEQRMVFSDTYASAWMKGCPSLANDDVPRNDVFATEFFYAQHFGV